MLVESSRTNAYVSLLYEYGISELTGGTSLTLKGEMKNILLDQSFFSTPTTVTSMYLMHVNLRNILPSVTFSTKWGAMYLMNVNLDAVPDQFANLSVQQLDMSLNYITEFPADGTDVATAFASSLTSLYAPPKKRINLYECVLTTASTTGTWPTTC